MSLLSRLRFRLFFLILAVLGGLGACQEAVEVQQVVYSNNFSTVDLRNFENGRLFVFENDTILGFYNREEVSVTVKELPPHNILKVEIELLIHDTWDGNVDDGISGPDIWYMKLDEREVFRTTFSNGPCVSTYCPRQSYPAEFFRINFPKEGAVQTNIVGLCSRGQQASWTTRYLVSRLIEHQGDSVKITLGDELKQTNTPWPLCDESWSANLIQVTALTVN